MDKAAEVGTRGFEYLVKWTGLPYADSTWEHDDLIERKFSAAVEQFKQRDASQNIPSKLCKVRVFLLSQTAFFCLYEAAIETIYGGCVNCCRPLRSGPSLRS